ncbi:MAG: ABC transporter permease [Rhizobiales bacterium NRL2]|jgi:branched-chain amino acid transport system permease protein|nr:MAG: ABC transporter permease [Rhizobiales bacterium NRL2]
MQIYISLLINGLSLGCIYGLIALGFVLIYKATEVVNFAQGDLMMVGAFVAFGLIGVLGLNYWLGFLLTIAVMIVFGFFLDIVVIRRLIGQPQFSIVMATIGIGYVLRFVMPYAYNVEQIAFLTPFTGKAMQVASVTLDVGKLAAMGGTLVLCAVLYFFFQRTRVGVAMQAASQNQLAAYYMGIPVAMIFSLIWGISAGVAGITGVMMMPIANVMDPSIGFIAIKAFAGAVVGGFGSIPGALVGGIIIGMVEQFSDYLLPAGYKDIMVFSVLLAVMVFRPEGIFSQMGRKKV